MITKLELWSNRLANFASLHSYHHIHNHSLKSSPVRSKLALFIPFENLALWLGSIDLSVGQ